MGVRIHVYFCVCSLLGVRGKDPSTEYLLSLGIILMRYNKTILWFRIFEDARDDPAETELSFYWSEGQNVSHHSRYNRIRKVQ